MTFPFSEERTELYTAFATAARTPVWRFRSPARQAKKTAAGAPGQTWRSANLLLGAMSYEVMELC